MPNALAHEKSPYLLQHAGNPVDWLPWGDAAFTRARSEQKPIFLSIGYSTCHWCHVMAHESFENPDIARLLNDHFVAIKIDREERPDVDRVYMAYVQALTGHGGWPLSAWLTPELKPFHGGTYFPPDDRHGRPGFPSILRAIISGWEKDRGRLVAEADRVIETLRGQLEEKSGVPPEKGHESPTSGEGNLAEAAGEAFEKCFQFLYETFDGQNGGFGGAPKFPRASNLNFLFRCAALQGSNEGLGAEAVKMAAETLQQMAQGGIHDHVGGGFHRYSVDAAWFVPHFEKMLYDQAQIALNFLEARVATGDERYAWLARDIFDYVARELTSPGGGFFSAEDADSEVPIDAQSAPILGKEGNEHAEGAFYVWTKSEIERAMRAEEAAEPAPRMGQFEDGAVAGTRAMTEKSAAFFCAHFGVLPTGNVPPEADPQGEFVGKNILAQVQPLSASAQAYGLTAEQGSEWLLAGLTRLRAIRDQRPHPQLDDKIITAWNGLMISALARAQQILAESDDRYLRAARRAAEFVGRELYDPVSGLLYRSYRVGRGASRGFTEDYAFLIQGLLDLYEASFESAWLEWAERLQKTMDELFWDDVNGGYFNSPAGDPAIVLRMKEDYDGAEPAPSSVAAMNLFRLGALFDHGLAKGVSRADEQESDKAGGFRPAAIRSYGERGRRTVEAFRRQWSKHPHALPQMLCALEIVLEAPRHVVLVGDPAARDFRALAAVLQGNPGPRTALIGLANDSDRNWWASRAPWLAAMFPLDERATAYVCEEFACQAPVTDPEEFRRLLGYSLT